MRKSFLFLLSLLFIGFFSCDDGDIITIELDFGETFEACEGVSDLVFYKTKNDPSESLSLLIDDYSLDDILTVSDDNTFSESKSAVINYRTYSDESISNLFCNDIPPNVNITLDESDSCTAEISTVLTEDDNDGIIAILEDINGNGNLEDDDTDGDGLPNYIDADDDGDNILTVDEEPDPNADNTLDDSQDTDGDGIPDYLDDDDDGDGVKTRDEENFSQDQRPNNDITNSDIGADYLNPVVANNVSATKFREHTIIQTYLVTINVTGISLSFISQEPLDFGFLSDNSLSDSRKVTPGFN